MYKGDEMGVVRFPLPYAQGENQSPPALTQVVMCLQLPASSSRLRLQTQQIIMRTLMGSGGPAVIRSGCPSQRTLVQKGRVIHSGRCGSCVHRGMELLPDWEGDWVLPGGAAGYCVGSE